MRWVSASRPLWLPPNIYCSSHTYILRALAPKKRHQVSSSPKSLGEMQLLWSGPPCGPTRCRPTAKKPGLSALNTGPNVQRQNRTRCLHVLRWGQHKDLTWMVFKRSLLPWAAGLWGSVWSLLPTFTATVSRQFEAASLIPFLQGHYLQSKLQLRLLLGPLVHFQLRQVFPN